MNSRRHDTPAPPTSDHRRTDAAPVSHEAGAGSSTPGAPGIFRIVARR